jgi:hypothetical protein
MTYVVHTDAPLLPLTQLAGDRVMVRVGRTPRGFADCFYGWAEPQDRPECKDHHILLGDMDQVLIEIAEILARLGHQVVVTAPDDDGDYVHDPSFETVYDNDHSH